MFTILLLLGVGILWGVTNPFIRLGSRGIETVNTGSKWNDILLEIRITMRPKYWLPFLLNQLGSVLYVYTLQSITMTAAVPVANSLSFAFTAVTGYLLGEQMPAKKLVFGTALVCLGCTLILYDKTRRQVEQTD